MIAALMLAVLFVIERPASAAVDIDTPCWRQEGAGVGIVSHGAGPLPSGSGPADFGMVPEACPGFDVLARLRGSLLVASGGPDFYGNIAGGLTLRVRRSVNQRTWVSLALDALTYRYVANAVVTSDRFSVGPPTFGLYHRLRLPFDAALAVYGRLLLPFDTARDSGVEIGGELGLSAWIPLGRRFGIQGGIALPAPVDFIGGQVHAAFAPAMVAEMFWTRRSLALFAGAGMRSQALPDPVLRSVGARAAVQLVLQSGLRLALAAELPVVGDDRTDAIVSLFATWTGASAPPSLR